MKPKTFDIAYNKKKGIKDMIYFFAHKIKPRYPYPEKDDIVQELHIAAWKAYEKFDAQKGCPFPIFIYINLKWKVSYILNKMKKEEIDLYSDIGEVFGKTDISFLLVDTKITVLKNFPQKYWDIFEMYLNGCTWKYISKQTGYGKGGVYAVINKITYFLRNGEKKYKEKKLLFLLKYLHEIGEYNMEEFKEYSGFNIPNIKSMVRAALLRGYVKYIAKKECTEYRKSLKITSKGLTFLSKHAIL